MGDGFTIKVYFLKQKLDKDFRAICFPILKWDTSTNKIARRSRRKTKAISIK